MQATMQKCVRFSLGVFGIFFLLISVGLAAYSLVGKEIMSKDPRFEIRTNEDGEYSGLLFGYQIRFNYPRDWFEGEIVAGKHNAMPVQQKVRFFASETEASEFEDFLKKFGLEKEPMPLTLAGMERPPEEVVESLRSIHQTFTFEPGLVDGRDAYFVSGLNVGPGGEGGIRGVVIRLHGSGSVLLSLSTPSAYEDVFTEAVESLSIQAPEEISQEMAIYQNSAFGYQFDYPLDHYVWTDADQMNQKFIVASDWNEYVAVAENESLVFCCEANTFSVTAVESRTDVSLLLDGRTVDEYVAQKSSMSGPTIEVVGAFPAQVYRGKGNLSSPAQIIVIEKPNGQVLLIQIGIDTPFMQNLLDSFVVYGV